MLACGVEWSWAFPDFGEIEEVECSFAVGLNSSVLLGRPIGALSFANDHGFLATTSPASSVSCPPSSVSDNSMCVSSSSKPYIFERARGVNAFIFVPPSDSSDGFSMPLSTELKVSLSTGACWCDTRASDLHGSGCAHGIGPCSRSIGSVEGAGFFVRNKLNED